jgi:ABC-type antimicrobial peptide transport system permease subunit
VICTALAAAIIYNLFMISAEERKRDYATMKTLGTSMPRLAYLIFLEGGAILVPGIILGVIGGWVLAYLMITLGTDFGAINFDYQFSWLGFFAGAGMMIGTVFVVSLLTLRYISKIKIADVIRERSS